MKIEISYLKTQKPDLFVKQNGEDYKLMYTYVNVFNNKIVGVYIKDKIRVADLLNDLVEILNPKLRIVETYDMIIDTTIKVYYLLMNESNKIRISEKQFYRFKDLGLEEIK